MRDLRSKISLLLLASTLPSCAGSDAGRAAIGTGIMIGVVAVHRAATGDCWARCSAGYLCDHESGLCVQGECQPACDAGYHCATTSVGHSCLPDALAVSTIQPSSPPPGPSPAPVSAPVQVQSPVY